MTIEQILKKYWGHDEFRPQQAEIIQSVINGHDTLALLPTGGGKSICFQIPALYLGGLCIVVSPLIALMKDQIENLRKRKIKASGIFSGMTKTEIDITLDNCIYGDVQFLYISPERLQTELFKVRFEKMSPSLIAVDEAHCISQWGYDFRPPYLQIAELKTIHPNLTTIALTASATNEVQKDIIEKLELKRPSIFKKTFARDNLSYSVFKTENKFKKLSEILNKVKGSSIVYTQTRKQTTELSYQLNKNGISADHYHAGLSFLERSAKQEAWLSGISRVIVATNAFGMGIDKPNVRTVINYGPSASLEAYYQEAGRAGRDGNKAYGVLLYDDYDLSALEEKIIRKYPSYEFIRSVYSSLGNLFQLAIGSKGTDSYEFDIQSFCENFKLTPVETFNALKLLESEGYIVLNESFFSPSKVRIVANNNELYDFQIANERFEKFIKTLLRYYGGELFSSYIFVNEHKFGRSLHLSEQEVIATLVYLKEHNIIDYKVKKDQPQISFLKERVNSDRLTFNRERIDFLKKSQLEKAKTMASYANERLICRTKMICEYFGEKNVDDCEICDNCLTKKKAESSNSGYYALILQELKTPLSIEEIAKRVTLKTELVELCLNELLRLEKIKTTATSQFVINEI